MLLLFEKKKSSVEMFNLLLFLILLENSIGLLYVNVFKNGEIINEKKIEMTANDCLDIDMKAKTLGNIISKLYYKSNHEDNIYDVYSQNGVLLNTCDDLEKLDEQYITFPQVHLVPKSKLFMFPHYPKGTRFSLNHVIGGDGVNPVEIESYCEKDNENNYGTRIFKLHNLFNKDDADDLIKSALNITEEGFALKRSKTGQSGKLFGRRTSDNAFDTSSIVAMKLKKRSFELLGIPYYDDRMSDGVQILRYNQTQAYATHLDYFNTLTENEKLKHNYNATEINGANRFATILIYLSDVEIGGETVFPYYKDRKPPEYRNDGSSVNKDMPITSASSEVDIQEEKATTFFLEKEGLTNHFPEDTWERDMIRFCQSNRSLSVKPVITEAVLFYSQHPNATLDYRSWHGACPVLKGRKWAANIWIWNRPRNGNWIRAPENDSFVLKPEKSDRSVLISFANDMPSSSLSLYFQKDREEPPTKFKDIFPDTHEAINSYVGHIFTVRDVKAEEQGLDSESYFTMTVGVTEGQQEWHIGLHDLDGYIVSSVSSDSSNKHPVNFKVDGRTITFTMADDAKCPPSGCNLYWSEQWFAKLLPLAPYLVNTFVGHEWRIENDAGVVFETKIEEAPLNRAVYIKTDTILRRNNAGSSSDSSSGSSSDILEEVEVLAV